MTRIVAILFILAGLWKGWLDYADTLAEGYALRFDRIGEVVYDLAPALLEGLGDQRWIGPVLELPLAPILLVIGFLLLILRSRRRNIFRR
ncbi:hypothetical protein ACMA5I_03925 [Paracoccaceae bacterium GXU_MW_L88]